MAWHNSSDSSHQLRILIDPGSEISFISHQTATALKLKRRYSALPVMGIGGNSSTQTRGKVTLSLKSIHRNLSVEIIAHIISQVSATLPSERCPQITWAHTEKLNLADPTFWKPQPVDLLIGADYYGSIIKPNIIRGSPTEPIAQLSIFGWLLLGPYSSETHNVLVHHARLLSTTEQLQDALTQFWIQEETPTSSESQLTREESLCEQHFVQTHRRDSSGRYQLRLPLKESADVLGNSFGRAQACLKHIIHKCNRDNVYKDRYISFMNEYISMHHMVEIPQAEIYQTPAYYLPHHGVLREDSTTTKLRAVFNGSAPTTTGVSLNDIMYCGQNLSPNIVDVLIWIRTHTLLFSTDITKMFRQIKVDQQDWTLQRILWIDEHSTIKHYYLTTVTYGTRAAPFMAIRTLLQLVKDEGHNYPLAVDSIIHGRYVDDIFGGAETQTELSQLAKQLKELCNAGGFPLAKWNSNSMEFNHHINKEPAAETAVSLDDCATKILGLQWLTSSDELTFKVNLPLPNGLITKRNILSEVAQIFDPLGIVSPVVINSKILLQELWLLKISWDEPLPQAVEDKWNRLREDLSSLHNIAIPRWLGTTRSSNLELHGFSDASQLAMAAVLYIKATSITTGSTVSLLISKTKVAPLKRLSIPRLELAAAALLSKLTRHILDHSRLTFSSVHLWTDSRVALAWIKAHPHRWKEFVANRVALIQELVPHAQWKHVTGTDNPADCASRGLLTQQLVDHQLWWHGPKWLSGDNSIWPTQHDSLNEADLPESKKKIVTHVAVPSDYNWDLIHRYSSLNKLLRITGWCILACDKFKSRKDQQNGTLTADILRRAENIWIKLTQQTYFPEELRLMENSIVPRNHSLNKLTAFLDQQKILRVGGRLDRAPLSHEARHPAILPKRSPFTTLVLNQSHRSTLHGGVQLTLAHTRQRYWIIGGRVPVKSHILQCVVCSRYRAQRAQQLMGQLPMARVTPSRTFSHTGIDYAGPLKIKSWKGRGSKTYKGWICVFVCFSTSAVHLELVTDYSTDAFMAAYRRFTSRRGIPCSLYSDCGTNFIGAEKELRTLFDKASRESSKLENTFISDGTEWRFNPPAAPHMGGKWEAVVKSTKFHLNRTVGDLLLTYEEATTLLTQIEAILNSRPLEPLSEDPDDLTALTPGHFLIGDPLNSVPEPCLLKLNESRLSKWQLIQQRTQQFWKKWSSHYLQRLQSISKWHHPTNNVKVNSMVLLTDERTSPSKWPLARVIQLHPGKDNLTRVVTLKTATTQLTRPISKLAILPVPVSTEQGST